ncbi:MAG: hypothetical protein Q8N18_20290 [Opitutaceae bacterium]|nr:hypothetical protein [Opitutaceae bacterium]
MILAVAGCQTVAPSALSAEPPPVPALAPSAPARPTSAPPAEAAVYRNPKIGVVQLRSYQDADGRLFGPQVMYQIVEPGGWNVEAAESKSSLGTKSEIPAPTLSTPSLMAENASVSDRPLLDPDQADDIVLTGLMHESDRPQAEVMARTTGDRSAIFDRDAGWFLLRRSPPLPP